MGITIKSKPKKEYPLCTKAGNSPYNKGGEKIMVELERIVDEYDYKGGKLLILRPVIDKLVYEYSFNDLKKKTHTDDLRAEVLQKLAQRLKTTDDNFRILTKEDVGHSRYQELGKTHKQRLLVRHGPTGSKIIVQIDPRKSNGIFCRFDLNPARLGPSGMKFFFAVFEGLLSTKAYPINIKTVSKIPMLIKRIDIAVDMLGVDASDLEGRYVFKDKKLKTETFKGHSGRQETVYFVKEANDRNQSYWYNKRKQLLEDKDYDDTTSPYGDALYTRYETRINETDKPLANLHSLLNHLQKVDFRAIDFSKIADKDFSQDLFLRYAVGRNLEKALEIIPPKRKAEFSAAYQKAMLSFWKPQQIWDKGWITELEHLGLYLKE